MATCVIPPLDAIKVCQAKSTMAQSLCSRPSDRAHRDGVQGARDNRGGRGGVPKDMAAATQGRRAAADSGGVDQGGRWARATVPALRTKAKGRGHTDKHISAYTSCCVQKNYVKYSFKSWNGFWNFSGQIYFLTMRTSSQRGGNG